MPPRPSYHTWGAFTGSNAVLVCHSFSANAQAADTAAGAGWWRELIGPGRAVDTDRWFVVATDLLPGACTVAEVIDAQDALRRHLGVPRWRLVTGGSMGGWQALAWGLAFPERVERAVIVAGAHRLAPAGVRHFRRGLAAIAGDQADGGDGRRGLSIALQDAQVFSGGPSLESTAVVVPSLDPATYQARARLLLESDPVQTWAGGDLERAAARLQAAVLLLGYRDDRVFSPTSQRTLAAAIRRQGGLGPGAGASRCPWSRLLPGGTGHAGALAGIGPGSGPLAPAGRPMSARAGLRG